MKSKYNSKLQYVLLFALIAVLAVVTGYAYYLSTQKPAQLQSTNTITVAESNYVAVPSDDFKKILDCFKSTGTDKQCLDSFITGYAGTKTTKDLLADLEVNRSSSPDLENNCHPVAHAIGRWTYEKMGNIGDAFLACDQTCHSGCYHGVMERLFYTPEQLATATPHLSFADMQQKVPHICDASNFKNPSQPVIFQCLHGVGHAILYSLDYNLVDALKSCDLFATDYERTSCYGGVIMENVTAFDKDKRDIKQGDYQYPCDKLDEQYKFSCYQMQTSLMFELGLTYEQMPAECDKAGQYANPCFVSIGRDLSNYVRTGNADFVVHVCEDLAGSHISNCVNGAVYALVDNTWDVSFAFPFCTKFKKDEDISGCFAAASSYAQSIYSKSHEDLAAACKQYAGSQEIACESAVPL